MLNTSTAPMTTDQPLIDNIASHPTPEGLLLTLTPAGVLPRLSAWLIDMGIRIIVMIVVMLVFSFLGTAGSGFTAIGYFLINWLYPVYFEVYRDGMTPGKKGQGIYVCHDDGTPISLQASMTRNLLRVADFLPFGFVAAALSMLFNRQSQRIGDMVAGTLVVYRTQDDIEKLYKSVYGMVATQPEIESVASPYLNQDPFKQNNSSNSNTSYQDIPAYDPTSPLFYYPLTLKEQQALVSFKARIPFLSPERQQEIVSALTPLVVANRTTPKTRNDAIYQAVLERTEMIVGASMINGSSSSQGAKR